MAEVLAAFEQAWAQTGANLTAQQQSAQRADQARTAADCAGLRTAPAASLCARRLCPRLPQSLLRRALAKFVPAWLRQAVASLLARLNAQHEGWKALGVRRV